jgi:hypothetical protein
MAKHINEGSTTGSGRRGQPYDGNAWHGALCYWRTIAAYAFTADERDDVLACMSRITSTMTDWRSAIGGDAAAAVGLALRMGAPKVLSPRVDVVMTVLLRSAFEDHVAALVMAHRLGTMPLEDDYERARLAASWLIHGVWLESRRQRRGRCRPDTHGDL